MNCFFEEDIRKLCKIFWICAVETDMASEPYTIFHTACGHEFLHCVHKDELCEFTPNSTKEKIIQYLSASVIVRQ